MHSCSYQRFTLNTKKSSICRCDFKHIFCSPKSLSNYFFRWLAYKSLLSRFSVLISYTMWSSNLLCVYSAVLNVFHGPGFSGSRFFRVQVFQGPGFSGFSFFWVWVQVQGLGPGFRSSQKKYEDVNLH